VTFVDRTVLGGRLLFLFHVNAARERLDFAFLGKLVQRIAHLTGLKAYSFFESFDRDATFASADRSEDFVEHGLSSSGRGGFGFCCHRRLFLDRFFLRAPFFFSAFFLGAFFFGAALDFFADALAFVAGGFAFAPALAFFFGAAFPLSFSMTEAIFSICFTREDSAVEIAISSF
jgi:hypothetical protein